jgi:peptidoglycan/xylan/chitin deacetylase (PgdA/CDA1 family)
VPVYEALRKIAFDERLKIHDVVLEGIDLALQRRGYSSGRCRATNQMPAAPACHAASAPRTQFGPGFGFERFKQYDFLRPNEVVLTFDDGPWPRNTPGVLKALADNCLKATFFEIGEHAIWHPEIAKQVAAAGDTIGSHTWSHKDLARNPYASDIEQAKQEIEMGVSAVHAAVGGPIAPFFRFPALQHPPELLSYLAERDIASFSTDIDSFDFKMHKPQQVIDSVMRNLQKHGKGIILMHDFQHRRGAAGNHPSAQGGRLQGGTRGATLASDDHPEVRRNGHAAG